MAKEKNVTTVGRIVLPRVQRTERRLLWSIQYASVGVAVLYLFGYIWRASYYSRLGIPQSLIDFPFPEILVPQSWCIVIFVVSLLGPLVSRKFYDFFTETRRDFVNKTFGTKCSVKEVIQYLGQKSTDPKYNTNTEAVFGALKEYISERKSNKSDFTKEGLEEFLRTKIEGLSREMKDSVISFVFRMIVLTDDVRLRDDIVKIAAADSDEESPKGYEIPTKIYWFVQLLFLGLLLFFGFWWGYWWNTGALILGNILGVVVYKLSYIENRVQFWSALLICFVTACGVQFVDGQLSAGQHLKEGRFPSVASLEIAGKPRFELGEDPNQIVPMSFLGCFKGKYIFASLGKFGWANLTIIDEARVTEVRLIYIRWMEAGIIKSRKELQQLKNQLDELNKEGDELKKQLKKLENLRDPNETVHDMS
jgi:hypothetical protein